MGNFSRVACAIPMRRDATQAFPLRAWTSRRPPSLRVERGTPSSSARAFCRIDDPDVFARKPGKMFDILLANMKSSRVQFYSASGATFSGSHQDRGHQQKVSPSTRRGYIRTVVDQPLMMAPALPPMPATNTVQQTIGGARTRLPKRPPKIRIKGDGTQSRSRRRGHM